MHGSSWCAIAVASWMIASAAPAPREASPTEWPLERIIANLEARLAEAPYDAEAHYVLGRAHAFAFALERSSLWTVGGQYVHERWKQRELDELRRERVAPPPPNLEQRLEHLAEGVRHLSRACALGAEPALSKARHHLTFAWLLETGAPFAAQVDTPALLGDAEPLSAETEAQLRRWVADLGASDVALAVPAEKSLVAPENLNPALALLYAERSSSVTQRKTAVARLLQRAWIERAIIEYGQALELAFPTDSSGEGTPPRNDEEVYHMVSYEALEGWRRLVVQRGVQSAEEPRLREIEARQAQLDALPRSNWITPLVVSLAGCATLDELVSPGASLPFDLDGDGIDELWPWLGPDAGWLVWDPEHRGEITSGRQLFGSASAWLFFEDGYRVLDALDDDRDGELRGAELTGIAVWFDRDTDGVSDRGEVVPVEELGIVAFSTQATMQVGFSPANLCGLEMSDGRVLPTYDWVLASVGGI